MSAAVAPAPARRAALSGPVWLLGQWMRRDYIVRYRQSLLGLAWAVVQPVFLLIVYGLIFTRALHVSTPGVPYIVFAFTGLTVWGFVSTALALGIPSVLNAQGIISKVWFPREIIPLAAVGVSLMDLAIGGSLLLVLALTLGSGLHWAMLSFVPIFLSLLLFTAAVALIGAAATVFVRDIRQALPLALQLTFIGTPIMYPETKKPGIVHLLQHTNPISIDVIDVRNAVVAGQWPGALGLLANLAGCAVFFLVALAYFRSVESAVPGRRLMGNDLVTFDHVSKSYRLGQERASVRGLIPGPRGDRLKGDIHAALSDISFSLAAGESLGIIGRNGAGKSTLLKLVAKVAAPTTGRVAVNGRIAALIELGTGFHPDMTGRENIAFSAAILGMRRATLRERLDQITDFAGIDAFLDTPVKRYSSGMLARLGFAVAAHLDAEVLLLDEVLSVGDARFQRRCHDRMGELRSQGVALLYVTHQLWSLPVLCEQALLLERGHAVASGTPMEVLRRYQTDTGPIDLEDGGRARVRSVTLSATELEPGAALSVRAEVIVDEPLPEGYLLVSILQPDSTVVTAIEHPAAALRRTGSATIECRLPAVPVAPGDYLVYATIIPSWQAPMVESQRSAPLRMLGEERPVDLYGATSVQPTWDEGHGLG